jgi:hypothetical protein
MRLYWFLYSLIMDVIRTVLKNVAVSKLTRPVSDLWDSYANQRRRRPNTTLYGRQRQPQRNFVEAEVPQKRSTPRRKQPAVPEGLIEQAAEQLEAGLDQYKVQLNLIGEGIEPDIAHDAVILAMKRKR